MRNQKGVSLITLVITIIVVIILAAIALGNGATDSISQADYAGFAQEIGELQDKVSAAIANAKGREFTRGNTRTTEQLANYVARGGDAVLTDDKDWLVQSDAEALQATLINKENARTSIGQALPERKVETFHGTKQEVSYYVTNKGTVFCWPPFIYDGKSYVTATTTVKNGTAELAGTDATKDGTLTLKLDGEQTEITIENKQEELTIPEMVRGKIGDTVLDGTKYKTVVFYDKSDDTDAAVGGVAEGITFTGYDNTVILAD